jgi:hypothetical protein
MGQTAALESQGPRPDRGYWPAVGALAAVYLALACSYAWRLPVLGGPDEAAHWEYVRVVRGQWRLPVLPRLAAPGGPRTADQAQHPPLYYVTTALVSYVFADPDDPACPRALKFLSVLMGLGTVLAMALLARRLWPHDTATAVAAVGVVALLPNVSYMTALLSNTAGSLLGSALALLALERALSRPGFPWPRWLLVGLAVGLAMLAKITAIWLLPTVAAGLLLKLVSERPPWGFGELMPERVLGRRYMPDGVLILLFQPSVLPLLLWVVYINVPLSMVSPWWVLRTTVQYWQALPPLVLFLAPAAVGGGDRPRLLPAHRAQSRARSGPVAAAGGRCGHVRLHDAVLRRAILRTRE